MAETDLAVHAMDLRVVRLEADLSSLKERSTEAKSALDKVLERLANTEQNWTTFKAVAGVLSALGLGVSVFVAVVAGKVSSLQDLESRVTRLSADVVRLEGEKKAITAEIVGNVVPQVLTSVKSSLPIPQGAVIAWWPIEPNQPEPAGWVPCVRGDVTADGYSPQFEAKAALLLHRESFAATSQADAVGKTLNISTMRFRCLMRQ